MREPTYRGVVRAAIDDRTRVRSLVMRPASVCVLALVVPALLACTKQAPDRVPPHAEGAAPPAAAFEGGDGAAMALPTDASAPTATATNATTAAAATSAARAPDAGAASTDADAGAPVRVKLATIGMHVGGGPYDEPTKEPMKRSVEPRFPELARCWRFVAKQQPTDVGVDLVIEAAGGRAKVSNPRTQAVGEGFVPCVVAFFESVDFLKPNNGKTVVSYSVRFSP
jgi:hypothetical protein